MIRKVLKMIFPSFFLKRRVENFIKKGGLNDKIWGEKVFHIEIKKAMERLLPEAKNDSKQYDRFVKYLVAVYFELGITPSEFLLLQLKPFIPINSIRDFLSQKDKDLMLMAKERWQDAYVDSEDKMLFYSMTKPYFKREICAIYGAEDKDIFLDFCKRHKNFIFKPSFLCAGEGVRIIREEYINSVGVDNLFNELIESFKNTLGSGNWFDHLISSSGGANFIIEELIEQSENMSEWNVSSVNSIRIPTIRTKSGIYPFRPFFRFGIKGGVVDNSHFGGYAVCIDEETGVLLTDALRIVDGDVLRTKPGTDIPIKGQVIPDWRALLDLVKEVHSSLPEYHHYMAFDFAHTDNKGWVLIEGNWGGAADVAQAVSGLGCRSDFNRLMMNTK